MRMAVCLTCLGSDSCEPPAFLCFETLCAAAHTGGGSKSDPSLFHTSLPFFLSFPARSPVRDLTRTVPVPHFRSAAGAAPPGTLPSSHPKCRCPHRRQVSCGEALSTVSDDVQISPPTSSTGRICRHIENEGLCCLASQFSYKKALLPNSKTGRSLFSVLPHGGAGRPSPGY